jgi:sugar lactone lactonase YvrE
MEGGCDESRTAHRACAEHGEGPFRDAADGRLHLVDLERGAVLAMTDGGTVDHHEIGGVTAALSTGSLNALTPCDTRTTSLRS